MERMTVLQRYEGLLGHVSDALIGKVVHLCSHGETAIKTGIAVCAKDPERGAFCIDCATAHSHEHVAAGNYLCFLCDVAGADEGRFFGAWPDGKKIILEDDAGRIVESEAVLIWAPLCSPCRDVLATEMAVRYVAEVAETN